MRFWTLAIYNLGRRPLRSALTVLGIAVAVACLVVMVGLSRGLEQAWLQNLQTRDTHILCTQKGTIDVLSTFLDAKLGEQIERVEGVRSVAAELVDMMTLETDDATIAQGWPPGCYLWETLRLTQGRLPTDSETNAVVMGQSLAEFIHKRPGDSLKAWGGTLKVVGVIRTGSVIGNNSVTLPLGTMQAMMGRQGKVTVFNLRVDRPEDPAQMAAVRARLQTAFPELSFSETSAVADNDLILRFFRAMAWSVSMTAMVIALVVVLNTLLMSVLERTREIGILSAIGWPAGRIVALIVTEGVILTLLGGCVGLGMGAAGLHWITSSPRVRGYIEVELTTGLLTEVVGGILLLGILGSLYPAWRGARLNSVDALQHE